jgi:hypothetical protein
MQRERRGATPCLRGFVISIRPRCAIHCAAMPWQRPNHVERSR